MKRLTAIGEVLDVSPEAFGEPRDSSDLLADPAALRRRIANEGYLLFREFFDRREVMATRAEITTSLAARGLLDAERPELEARASSAADTSVEAEARRFPGVRRLLHGPQLTAFFECLLGAPVRAYDHVWMRLLSPGKVTGPHCDIVYMGRGTQELFTTWVPLGDVELEEGALLILEGSNQRRDLARRYRRMDVDRLANWRRPRFRHGRLFRGGDYSRNPPAVQREFGLRWLTCDYRAGDLVVMTAHTMHGSLDNLSDRIRISADTRYQLAAEPIDERWVGDDPAGHVR